MPRSRESHASPNDRAAFVADAARRAFVLDEIPNLTAVPELFTRRLCSVYVSPIPPSGGAELHAVGVADAPASEKDAGGSASLPVVRVNVRRSEQPVALFLMTYYAVCWELRVEPGVQIAGVFLSSYEPSLVRCPVPVAGILPLRDAPQVDRFDATGFGEDSGRRVLQRIRASTGRDLTSFQGDSYAARFAVPPYRDAALVREVIAAHGTAVHQRTARAPGPFWLIDDAHIVQWDGRKRPIPVRDDIKAVTFCGADDRFYGVSDHALYAIDASGGAESIPPPAAGWSWLGGVTYDSARRRLVVSTFWHAGAHHFYDPLTRTWLAAVDVGQTGGGIRALAYDATRDVIFAVSSGLLGARLTSYTGDLEPLNDAPHSDSLPLPDGFSPDWPVVQMATLSDTLAIVLSNDPIMRHTDSVQRVERGFLVRIAADDIRLLDVEPRRAWAAAGPAGANAEKGASSAAPESGASGDEVPQEDEEAPYEGSVSVYELRRDANTIIRQVATTGQPLMVLASGHGYAMLASYERYLGQLSSLDETRFSDWNERLERAKREIADATVTAPADFAPWPSIGNAVWTRQAAENLTSLLASAGSSRRTMIRQLLLSGKIPMDGPYAGYWCSTSALGWRTIFQRRGDQLWIAYIRQGVKHIWGPLAESASSE